jgi:hypothetical protein
MCKSIFLIYTIYRQLLKIPRFGIIEEYSLNLLRALRFFLKYFFFNRVARYTQSKESRNLSKKIPQITCKAIFRSCLKQLIRRDRNLRIGNI